MGKLTLGQKCIITVALAFVVWWIFGCASASTPCSEEVFPNLLSSDTTIAHLDKTFRAYNSAYFGDKLPTPKIYFQKSDSVAITMCKDDGTDCEISFNLKYAAAPRYADLTLLHEMCHMRTWKSERVNGSEAGPEHGPKWQTCMLSLETMGANRELLIDGYTEHAERVY